MATAVAYGSLTVVDITDIAEFSVQPMSNLPLAVVYNPDQGSYTPNWSSSNLQLTPSVYYGGESVALGTTGLTITWERQEGVSSKTAITTGETIINNGVLSVTANKFTPSIPMITYIVTAQYTEPTSQQTLTAQGQITFSLVKNASSVKSCSLSGETVFKYNASQTLVGNSSITITATVNNVSISSWKYQNGSGSWVTYPNSDNSSTLVVNATDNVFFNDKCVIKLVTSDNNIFDVHTITKLKDGAAGTATVSAVLTNDDQMIPFDKSGVGDFSSATSQIIIYESGQNVTSSYSIAQTYDNVTATASRTDVANDTVAVTAISASTGNVTFTCTRSGYDSVVKTFSLVKVEAGADGVTPTIYSLEADTYAINKSITGVLTPTSVTFTGYSQTGGNAKTDYSGRFQIFENLSLTEYDAASPKPSPVYSSTSNESSYTYTPTSSARSVLCILYKAGATSTRYDSQQVIITSDGATGATGASAINIVLGNYADVLACTANNVLSSQQVITIPFAAYEGTTKIPCTVSNTNLLGVIPVITNATASADGSIVWILPSDTPIANDTGTLTLVFTATASTGQIQVTESYTWIRATAARNGENSVLLQIFTPNGGNVLSDTVTSVTLQGSLLDGSTDSTINVTSWQWAKFANGAYSNISGATSSSYSVNGSMVDSYASFR